MSEFFMCYTLFACANQCVVKIIVQVQLERAIGKLDVKRPECLTNDFFHLLKIWAENKNLVYNLTTFKKVRLPFPMCTLFMGGIKILVTT